MMNFNKSKIVFFDKYAEHNYEPMGPHRRTIVGDQLVVEQRPTVTFNRHQFTTDDPKLARAMVESKPHFEGRRNYYVSAESIPDPSLAKIYPTLHVENKRSVILALIEGASVEDAKEMIDPAREAKPEDDAPKDAPTQTNCPFCNQGFQGAKNIRATMLLHVQTQHSAEVRTKPEWRDLIAS